MWILVFTLHKKMVISYQNTSLTNKCRVTIKRKIIDLELHKAENRLPPFFCYQTGAAYIYSYVFYTVDFKNGFIFGLKATKTLYTIFALIDWKCGLGKPTL